VLVPRSEEPAYRVFVRASFAEYLAEWLLDAAAEYRGVAPLDLTAPVFMRLRTRVPDRPGGLAGLLAAVATAGANVIELSHVRDDADLPLAQTGVELLVELRGAAHADALATDLDAAGYPTRTAA
jgi:hypothetical protein